MGLISKICFQPVVSYALFILILTSSRLAIAQPPHPIPEPEFKQLLQLYQSQLANQPNGEMKYHCALSKLPRNQLYTLFIDKKRLLPENQTLKEQDHLIANSPAYLFDVAEPGYHDGMTAAFEKMSKTMNLPLSMGLIRDLHDTAMSHAQSSQGFLRDRQCYNLGANRVNAAQIKKDVFYTSFMTFRMNAILKSAKRRASRSIAPWEAHLKLLTMWIKL